MLYDLPTKLKADSLINQKILKTHQNRSICLRDTVPKTDKRTDIVSHI